MFNLQCLCKHCNRSKQASLKDTVPDLAKNNSQRVVKAVKKQVASAKTSVAQSVKSAAKNAVKKVFGSQKKKATRK